MNWLPLPLGEGWGEGLGGCVPFRKLVLRDEGLEDDTNNSDRAREKKEIDSH
jgi:hypothetical protein